MSSKREICETNSCTGCWACVNACPKGCISMACKDLLHLYPTINTKECINCGKCISVCQANKTFTKREPRIAYASRVIDNANYLTSSSGGMGAAFAETIINRNGVVYGCACLPNGEIRHIRISDRNDLHLLKGSKYVQSFIGYIFQDIKRDLVKGLPVLFIGTPCQVAGLRLFLNKEYENLVLVDLICHGVPSIGYLKRHIYKKTGEKQYDKVVFRQGNDMSLVVVKSGKEIYRKSLWNERYKDEYYNAFIDGYSYRPSCHTCQYASRQRVSDITIGDFWGLTDDVPFEHHDGLSCMLINSSKGYNIFEEIKDNLFWEERLIMEAVAGNDQLRYPCPITWRIKLFNILHRIVGISNAYRLLTFDKKIQFYHPNNKFVKLYIHSKEWIRRK